MAATVDQKDKIIYGSKQRYFSPFSFVLAVIIGDGGWFFWKTGETIYAAFMIVVALLLLTLGLKLFSQYERIVFDFVEKNINYQKRGGQRRVYRL